jgi:hypothetical protein
MDEREELRGRLEAYAAKAARIGSGGTGRSGDSHLAGADDDRGDLGELFRRAREVLDARPADVARARALVAAYQAYLASRSTQVETPGQRGTR